MKKEYYEFGFELFSPFNQKKYLGFSLLYIGRIKEGIFYLEELTKQITEKSASFLHKYKSDIIQIITAIRNNPEKTQEMLNGFAIANMRALKLKVPKI